LLGTRLIKQIFSSGPAFVIAVPREFKNNMTPRTISLSFLINNNVFYISKKRSKHSYSLLMSEKAQFSSAVNALTNHEVIYIYLLFTNTKLYKIGFRTCNKFSFCKTDLETLHHLLYSCPYSKTFWDEFELYWFSITKERISLSQKD